MQVGLLGEGAPGSLAFVGDGINERRIWAIGAAMGGMARRGHWGGTSGSWISAQALALRISRKPCACLAEHCRSGLSAFVLGALANMWVAIFADVGVMVLCVLNAARALNTKHM